MWPEVPIDVVARIPKSGRPRSQGVNNVLAALKQHPNRVSRISIRDIPNSLLKKLAAIKTPFPALMKLTLSRADEAPVLFNSFLKGSAPRLQWLSFDNIPFPALGKLPLSTCHLSDLSIYNIPYSGNVSPDVLVTSLSGSTGLKTLVLKFQYPRSRAARESRVPPPLTPVVLPTLSYMDFKGDSDYLEDMLSRMNLPLQVLITATFFNQLVFRTPLLRNHIIRKETLREFGSHRGVIAFTSDDVYIVLFQKHGGTESKVIEFLISCRPPDWQLSSLVQLIRSSIPTLPALEHLELRDTFPQQRWQDDIMIEHAQWLELLRPFAFVKGLVLSGNLIPLVAPALGELTGERVTEELPALQTMVVQNFRLSGPSPWQKEIGRFVTARQISGRPVAVHYQESSFIYT